MQVLTTTTESTLSTAMRIGTSALLSSITMLVKLWQSIQPPLHLLFYIKSTLPYLRQWIGWIMIVIHKLIIHSFCYLKFHCIIGSCDGIKVPFNKPITLYLLHVLNRKYRQKVYKYCHAGKKEASLFSYCYVVSGYKAWCLEVEVSLIITLLSGIVVHTSYKSKFINVDGAFVFAVAIFYNLVLKISLIFQPFRTVQYP